MRYNQTIQNGRFLRRQLLGRSRNEAVTGLNPMNRIFVSLITAAASAELLLESTAIAGTPADARFAELEALTKSRVGVAAIDLSTNRRAPGWRAWRLHVARDPGWPLKISDVPCRAGSCYAAP